MHVRLPPPIATLPPLNTEGMNANGKHVGADSASLCSIAGCGGDRRTNRSETGLALLRGIGNFYALDEKARKNEDSDREAKQTQEGEHGCDRPGDHREDRLGYLDRQRDLTRKPDTGLHGRP